MFVFNGRVPKLFLITAVFCWLPAAQSQQLPPLTLAEAENLALDDEPGTTALAAKADALEERSIAAGQLPEPTLKVGINNYPVESGGFSTEGMTNAGIGLHQAFPPGDSRRLGALQYASRADEMTESATARSRDVLSAVRKAWLEVYYWQQAGTVLGESRAFFNDLAEITRSLYAVGRRNQQDVLRAELELSRLEDKIIEAARQERQSRAELGRWIGEASARPITTRLPDWNLAGDLELLQTSLGDHPALLAADARVQAADAAVHLAEEQTKPGWAVDLGYSYRQGTLPDGDPRSDMVSLNVTVGLPFVGTKNRRDRDLAAALGERRAATSSRVELDRDLHSRLRAEYARWQEYDRRLELFEGRILAQTADLAQAALSAYQSDTGDFADVMRGYIDNLNVQLDYSRLQVERAKSYATLANLGGIPR